MATSSPSPYPRCVPNRSAAPSSRCSRARAGLAAAALASALLAAGPAARADTLVVRPGQTATVHRSDVLLVRTGASFTMIERLTLESDAPQFVWIRPFRIAPIAARPSEDPFPILGSAAVTEPTWSERVRARLFGPSIVELARARWGQGGWAEAEPLRPPEAPKLTVLAMDRFAGEVRTATELGPAALPDRLEAFLRRFDVRLDEAQQAQLSRHLAAGWTLVAAAVRAPTAPPGPRALGPLRFVFEGTEDLTYPLLRRSQSDGMGFAFHVLAPKPRVPDQVTLHPDPRAALETSPPGVASVRRSAPLDEATRFSLTEILGRPVAPSAQLTQMVFRPGVAALDELFFVAPEEAADAARLPTPEPSGGAGDVFQCLLLGLVPLFLAPESWLLLWLQGLARERARRGERSPGVKLWSIWPLATAAFWFLALEGPARMAALAPLVVGIALLALPWTDREPDPVRARFEEKKKRPRRRVTADLDPDAATASLPAATTDLDGGRG